MNKNGKQPQSVNVSHGLVTAMSRLRVKLQLKLKLKNLQVRIKVKIKKLGKKCLYRNVTTGLQKNFHPLLSLLD